MKALLYLRFLTLVFFVFSYLMSQAQPNTMGADKIESREVDLSGSKWRMKMMRPGEGVKAGLHELPPEDIETLVWNLATVPGDVYTDLWKVGVIDDPYFGRNSVKAQWVQQYEWWYTLQFNVHEPLNNDKLKILFEGVDYSCDVWLNGKSLGRHEGAFSSFSFDINEAVRIAKDHLGSSNMLTIKLDPPPQVNALVAGRKTPWFGDYWRDLIPFGIWRPIKLIRTGQTRIQDLYVETNIKSENKAAINLKIEVENTTNKTKTISFNAMIKGKNFDFKQPYRFSKKIKPGVHQVTENIDLKTVKLWWSWDLGEPNLYEISLALNDGDQLQDLKKETFGLRKVEMKWNPGFTKEEVSFPRSTYINGKFHFIRSACWGGPPDIFVGRTSVEEYRKLIQMAKDANMNNIRIFGWHPPEIPEFYQLCDEAGITVWQDMIPMGTGNIPREKEQLHAIFNEAVSVIKERRNHPSLIMMEGGEEMMLRARDPQFARQFLERLGDSLQRYAPLPYVPDSPLTCEVSQKAGYKPKEAVHALRYFYAMGDQLMEQWYKSLEFPIVPEFAITSVPSVESLKKFIPADELWPPGLSWGHHWADLDRLKMQHWDTFGDTKTRSLEEFVKASQQSQGIIFQNGIEDFRRHKPNLSGIALCHFITYWPDMKWGLVDNYQKPKLSLDYVRKAYQPLLVNLNFEKRRWKKSENFKAELWVVNDFYKEYESLTAKVILKNDDLKKLKELKYKIANIAPNSAKMFFEIDEHILNKVDKQLNVVVELRNKKGDLVSSNDYFFLIGDQEEAAKEFKAMGDKRKALERKYTYPNYFRFFDMKNGGKAIGF